MQFKTPIQIPPGVVRGATSKSTPNRWYDTSLVRWREGVMAPIGGWTKIDVPLLTSTARTIYGWLSTNEARHVAIGCDAGFYSLWETQLIDITPDRFIPDETTSAVGGFGVGLFGDGDFGTGRDEPEPDDFLTCNLITLDNFGTLLMGMSETDGRLLVFDPRKGPVQRFQEVKAKDGAPPVPRANRSFLVSPERFVIAIGADGNSRRVAWCSREDFTDWDYASLSNTAGNLDLDATSALSTIRSVRDGSLIFSQSEVFLMKFIGGQLVHGFQKISENTSLICPYAVATFNGDAMWMTRSGFKRYSNGVVRDIPCTVMDYLLEDMDPKWARLRTHAVVNNVFDEVTWYYKSKTKVDAPSPIKAIDNTFTDVTLVNGAFPMAASAILGNDIGSQIHVASIGTTPLTQDDVTNGAPSNTANGGWIATAPDGSYLYTPPPADPVYAGASTLAQGTGLSLSYCKPGDLAWISVLTTGLTPYATVGTIEDGWTLEQDISVDGVARARLWSRTLTADYLAGHQAGVFDYPYFVPGSITVAPSLWTGNLTTIAIPQGMTKDTFVKRFAVVLADASTSFSYQRNPLTKSSLVDFSSVCPRDNEGPTVSGWTKVAGNFSFSVNQGAPQISDQFVPGPYPVNITWTGFPYVFIEEHVFELPETRQDSFPYTIANNSGQTSSAEVYITTPNPPPLRPRPNYYNLVNFGGGEGPIL
ncbi:hypothetical protein FF100_22015 [Methylobacterium terricola]|uniref:Uncharacterized protein n=1 Tax=Methylobacterium terricola TaxID=2583531 RepID=A0A5C4LE37_9HYPH|nr:hypothetical protein [Methylobacterium terricola]TNC10829.1 hypothetical protein FF100_22015 [Methylobacterium terricola]